jgi:hypothetical protein
MTGRTRKAVALLFVTGIHVAVIVSLSRLRNPPLNSSERVYGTYILIEPPNRAKPQLRIQQKGSTTESAEPIESIQLMSDLARIAPSIDWQEEGRFAVGSIVNRKLQEESLRPLSKDLGATELERRRLVQDPVFIAPTHKRGDTEHFDDGELATWIDNGCYATNKDFGEQRSNANTVVLVCKGNVGTPPIRHDMFEHLKPNYLRVPETASFPELTDSSVK